MDSQTYSLLDVQNIQIENPTAAVKTFSVSKAPGKHREIDCDILIAGGSMGGIAAAIKIAECSPKLKVCLTEETSWLGGQMTSQGVSALDENQYVETSGACLSYQKMRDYMRLHYKTKYKLSPEAQEQVYLNPGNNWVSRLSFEPLVATVYIDEKLSQSVNTERLQIFKRHKVANIETQSNAVKKVLAFDLETGASITFKPKICLDATELGDLLPLAKVPYSVGSDNREETTEPHAPITGDKENVQDYVYPFVVDFHPGTDNTTKKPEHYDEFNSLNKFGLNGYKMFADSVVYDEHGDQEELGKRVVLPFWTYRRLIDKNYFEGPNFPFDIAMINWDSNDLRGYNIIDQTPQTQATRLALAKSLSLGFLYWLQKEATRDDEGTGYKELFLRTDVLGTHDGLSMYPYIRESRRIKAKRTIIEQDIVARAHPTARARACSDSVGIGQYFVDIHGMQEISGTAQSTRPFQIPLSALIPENGGNLLPCCKNIGVTHITNGAYRLHPIEWAIGEAQGTLAAYCLEHHRLPEQVLQNPTDLKNVQQNLIENGAPLFWFDDVPTSSPFFAAAQHAAQFDLLEIDSNTLHFNPEANVSQEELDRALTKLQIEKSTTVEKAGLSRAAVAMWLYDVARAANKTK
ncbi:MAG: FAD-dependent oxidoreductase [Candidatus Obscuribacterales bacterium]|nr:FAD-dependent oxidoreductase [Candidatus Obscuribacterales bacterium]